MLDRKSFKVLKVLNSMCEEGTYKVIDYDSLIEKLSSEKKSSKLSVDQILEHLKLGQYIDIKYAENNTYCLSVLPKGRMIIEESVNAAKTQKRSSLMLVLTALFSGIMAFIGAFLAIYLFK